MVGLDDTFYREQQQASAEVPEWALDKASKLLRSENPSWTMWDRHLTAFARYIAAHEPAPVDPLDALRDSIEALHGISFDRDKMEQIVKRARVTVKEGEQ